MPQPNTSINTGFIRPRQPNPEPISSRSLGQCAIPQIQTENAREFKSLISARRNQRPHRTIGQRTDFVMCWSAALTKKPFDPVQIVSRCLGEHPESERLRNRRVRRIEHRACPRDFRPLSAAGLDKCGIRHAFGEFKPLRKRAIGKENCS